MSKNVLIYKRTHIGDPNENGIFGINGCMGRVRDWSFDAVIGVGGKSPWKKHNKIALKINWIGIGAKKIKSASRRNSLVVFKKFYLKDDLGCKVEEIAPKLFNYIFIERHVRAVLSSSLSFEIQEEIDKILNLANKSNPSKYYNKSRYKIDNICKKRKYKKLRNCSCKNRCN